MKKNIRYITIVAACMAVAAMIIGCKSNITPAQDTTAPAEVTELKGVAGNGKVSLSWKNPGDADLYQVEITASPAAGTLTNPVYLSAEKGKAMSFTAEGLTNGTAYTFTVKTIDKSLNKSKGVTTEKPITPTGTGDKTPPQGGGGGTGGTVMSITLTQSPAKETKTNGSVTVAVASSTSIKDAKWKKGEANAKTVLESGTAITDERFTVSENGIYSVAVLDNDGRREVETIKIENIDKTPPAKVKSLSAVYDSGNQKIIVTWTNPTDSDFAGLTLSWKKGTGSETAVALSKTDTQYILPASPVIGDVYTISVIAKDDVGNASDKVSVSAIASLSPSLSSIELNRTHLAYNDTNLTIIATLKGRHFDLIASQSDPTVKAGIFKDNALVGSLQNASPDGANYKVTLTAPRLSSDEATVEGAVYTVKVKLCGTYQSVTETFVISKEARLTARPELSVTQIASSEVTSSTTTKITLKGINLDVAGGITVQLYDSNGATYGSAVPIDTSHTGRELTTLTADIPVPSDEGVFTAKALFGGVIQTSYYEGYSYNSENTVTNPTIQVYGSLKFISFTIPNAGISKENSTVTATVKGANFKAPGVTASDFSVSCATSSITNSSAITIIDDATLKVSLTIPGTANDYTVTISSGSVSTTGTFAVKDYSAYTVGKIVLADNTLKSKDEYTTIDSSNPPVGIICTINGYGVPQMIALHTSGSGLRWAKSISTGCDTKFEGIICRPSQRGKGAAQTATFTGDTDGSDNWEYIKQQDPAGAADAATNYPAFHWVNQYNTQYAVQLGGTNFAWYMPSLAELCEVYKNRDAINESLVKIHGLNSGYADSTLGTSWYWSSSQDSGSNDSAWAVVFSAGNVGRGVKYDPNLRVCCLAGF